MPQIREQIAMVHLPPSKTLKYLFHVRKTLDVYPNPTLRGERYLSKQKDTPYRNGRECFLCI